MFLLDLLQKDATRFAARDSAFVASEEFIHLMLDAYSDELRDLTFIKIADVPVFLQKKHDVKIAGHTQLFVEYAERHPLNQKDQDGIHYAAMDVFCDESGKIVVFMADQYKAPNYANYPERYNELFNFPIHFIVAGGSPHQMDGKSCPIFTLRHLLLTAQDTALHQALHALAAKGFEYQHAVAEERFADILGEEEQAFQLALEKPGFERNLMESGFDYALARKEAQYRFELEVEEQNSLNALNQSTFPDAEARALAEEARDSVLEDMKNEYERCLEQESFERALAQNGTSRALAKEGFISVKIRSKMTPLPWFDLGPEYNINTQSFTQITRYVDHVKQKEARADDVDSHILHAASFDHRLAHSIKDSVNRKNELALKNEGIKDAEEEYAARALVYAENLDGGEEDLIDICYGDSYLNVGYILQQERRYREEINSAIDRHPQLKKNQLVPFIFSNQGFLNLLTEDKMVAKTKKVNPHQKLYEVFMSEHFLCLIQRGYLDLDMLFERITVRDRAYYLSKDKGCDVCVLHGNLVVALQVLELLKQGVTLGVPPEKIPETLLDLFLMKDANKFFEVPAIVSLYASGRITNEMLQQSTLYKLRKSPVLRAGTPEEVKQLINNNLRSPVSITCSEAYESKGRLGFFHGDQDKKEATVQSAAPGMRFSGTESKEN